jgi:uncharacterized heparinase superfamily protein
VIFSLISNPSLYFYTIRYLKPQQIYRRLLFRLVSPRVDAKKSPELRVISFRSNDFSSDASQPIGFLPVAQRQPSLLDAETFVFINQAGSLPSLGWDGQAKGKADPVSKLWRYNQHYFDDLNAAGAEQRVNWHQALLLRWFAENPPGLGVGWDPYPTSLRLVNWVKWELAGKSHKLLGSQGQPLSGPHTVLQSHDRSRQNALPDVCVQSLAVQARWLMQRIEWHLLGNHLFANAKALVFVGVFFSGDEAQRWLKTGLKIIADELSEQVLKDGGNFERSPMYHAIFLEDLLDLINIAQAYPGVLPEQQVVSWVETASKMLGWLNTMTHPDGEIAFFNDAAIGIAPNPKQLQTYAMRLNVLVGLQKSGSNASLGDEVIDFFATNLNMVHLSDSGYVAVTNRDAAVFLDVAPIGPDYLPGHAHADTLSFELSLFGERVFVNCGTSAYGTGEVRQFERSTAAHNTVMINDQNSSEVWGGFRVARRAYPRELVIDKLSDGMIVSCAHDGYKRLKGKPIHRRSWRFRGASLVVEDRVEGHFDFAFAYFHIHPSIRIEMSDASFWSLYLEGGQRVLVRVEVGDAQLVSSHYAPEFGKRLTAQCLKVALGNEGSRVRVDWDIKNEC